MVSEKERKRLLVEAHKINYRLRSTFFYRKLSEYHTYEFPEIIQRLVPISEQYDWTKYNQWGITKNAFNEISKSRLKRIQIFAHPRVLREQPILVAYYRNVAALSQKSVSYLSGISPQNFENGNSKDISESDALGLSLLFNEHISLIIESALEGFDEEQIKGLLFASTGAQIDGSWRNAIGTEAEKVVQKMLIKEAINKSQLTAFLLRGNGGIEKFDGKHSSKQLDRISEFRGFALKNKKSVIFSSEPDVSLIDQDGSTIAVIEVKGGADPAGALERYGAVEKSFEESLKKYPKITTILVANGITSEAERRIRSNKKIKKFFNLASLLTREDERQRFLNYIFKTLLGA